MADKADGSIVINTELDTGDVIDDTNKVNAQLQRFARDLIQLGARLRDMWKSAMPPEKQPEIKTPEVEEPEIPEPPGVDEETTETVEAYSAELREAERAARSLSLEMARIDHASEMGFRNYGSVLRFSDSVQHASASIAEAEAQLATLSEAQLPTEDYAGLQRAIELSNQELAKLYVKQGELKSAGIDEESKKWTDLADQIAKAEEEASYLADLRDRMEGEGTAFINPADTAQYQQLDNAIQQAQNSLERNRGLINEQSIAQARLNVVTAQEAVAAAQTTREREKAMQQLTMAQNELAYIAQKNVTPQPDPEAVTNWEAFRARLKSVGQTMVSAIGSGSSKAFGALKSGLKKAVGWLKNLRSHTRSASSGMSGLARTLTSMRTMLTSRLKRTFISQIINTAKESIGALAQFDSAVDRAISGMKNGLKGVGANLAVSFGSILQTIAPIITAALDAVSTALTRVNALIAALRGAKTVTVAKKQTDSYAASLNGAAGSAGKAAAAQKKLNAQLTSYDELHKLSDNSDSGAEAATNGADMFENVPVDNLLKEIPTGVQDAIQQIKEAVKNGDWRGVGSLIADGLNGVVNALTGYIPRIKRKAAEVASAIAEGINGFTSRFNFENAGILIGNSLGVIVSTLNAFITGTDWGALGAGLAAGINGIFSGINWAEVGQTAAAGVNGLFDFIYSAITTADWPGYGASLGDAVSNFITTTDWSRAGASLGEAVKGLLGLITGFIENTDWWAVGEAVWDAIAGIDWGGVAEALFEGIGAAVVGAVMLLGGLASKIMSAIKNAIITEAKSLGWDLEGASIIEGLLMGIVAALHGIARWIVDHIFKPIWNGIKKAFGIASPAKEMKPLGGFIIEGLLNGIVAGVGAILEFFKNLLGRIWDTITGAIESVAGAVRSVWDGIKGVFTGAAEAVKTGWNAIAGFFTGIWNGIKGAFAGVAEFFGEIFGGAADAVQTAWNAIGEFFTGIWTGITTAFEGAVEFFSGIFSGAADAVLSAWSAVTGFFADVWDGIAGAFDEVVDFFGDIFTSAWNGITTAWSTVGEFFSGIWSGIQQVFRSTVSWFITKFQGARDAVERIWNGIKSFFSTVWGWIQQPFIDAATWFYNKFVDVVEAIKAPFTGLIGWFQDLWEQIKEVFSFGTINSKIQDFAGQYSVQYGPPLPQMAGGGVLKRGQVGILEGNGAEAVVPLENNRKWIAATAAAMKASLKAEGMLGAGSQTTAVTRGINAIAEKLGAIATQFNRPVAMPAPAIGTDIPPRTMISDQAVQTSGKGDDGIAQKLNTLIELLTAQQSRDNTINISVPVELDQRQIGNAVARYSLSRGRSMNGNGGLR